MSAKLTPPERIDPKPPIYPVSVIEVACRALEVLNGNVDTSRGERLSPEAREACDSALRIIRDGLASHEKAIRGEP